MNADPRFPSVSLDFQHSVTSLYRDKLNIVMDRLIQDSNVCVKLCICDFRTSLNSFWLHHLFILHGFIPNPQNIPAPSWLWLAPLVEHCTSIAQVMGSTPVVAKMFVRLHFHYCSRRVPYTFFVKRDWDNYF